MIDVSSKTPIVTAPHQGTGLGIATVQGTARRPCDPLVLNDGPAPTADVSCPEKRPILRPSGAGDGAFRVHEPVTVSAETPREHCAIYTANPPRGRRRSSTRRMPNASPRVVHPQPARWRSVALAVAYDDSGFLFALGCARLDRGALFGGCPLTCSSGPPIV
jgi:hypothetical protein